MLPRTRRRRGRASLAPALTLAVVITGCASTEHADHRPSSAVPPSAVAAYDALSADRARADMRRVVACAGRRGVTVRADVVNNGYAAKESAQSLHSVIGACRTKVYGARQDLLPRAGDAGRVYDLYRVQAICLGKLEYRVPHGPNRTHFVRAFRPGRELPWMPFYGDRTALPRWASAHDMSPQTAYESLLTACPDPVRMWRYVDPAYRS